MRSLEVAVFLVMLFAACSSSTAGADSGSASVTGAVGGRSFAAQGARGVFFPPPGAWRAKATIANFGQLCGTGRLSHPPPNAIELSLDVIGTGSPATGTYPVNGGNATPLPSQTIVVGVSLFAYDAQCTQTVDATGQSGSVTLTEIDSSTIAGSFDVSQFIDPNTGAVIGSDHLTGTFTAPVCSVAPVDAGSTCGM